MDMIDDRTVYINNLADMAAIEDWLMDNRITLLEFDVIDLDEPRPQHIIVVKIVFADVSDAVMFKLMWMGR